MSEGYFVAHVYTSNALIPIADATVIVTQKQAGGTAKLLAARTTDSSGLTAPITIPTPEVGKSLEPNQGIPFALVDITVDHPDYLRISAENVQIFPGISTNQNFVLIPISALPESWDRTEDFNTPSQNL